MSVENIVLYCFVTLTLGGALSVWLLKNVLHAALGLLIAFLGMAGLFVLANAPFLAVVQIMVYIGGVVVLMIFGIMFTSRVHSSKAVVSNEYMHLFIALSFATALAYGLIKAFKWSGKGLEMATSTTENIGVALLTQHIWAFEYIALVLLVVLIGAVFVASKKNKTSE